MYAIDDFVIAIRDGRRTPARLGSIDASSRMRAFSLSRRCLSTALCDARRAAMSWCCFSCAESDPLSTLRRLLRWPENPSTSRSDTGDMDREGSVGGRTALLVGDVVEASMKDMGGG